VIPLEETSFTRHQRRDCMVDGGNQQNYQTSILGQKALPLEVATQMNRMLFGVEKLRDPKGVSIPEI